MLDIFVKTFFQIITFCVDFLLRFCQIITKHQERLVEGELEIIEWCKECLGFNGLEELWENGAREVANLLEDGSETWKELHATAVRKINITPTMDVSQLSSPRLERKARQNFVLFLKKIMMFSKQDALGEIATRVSADIVARGVGLYAAYTRRRAVFYVYSNSGKLNNIIVHMKGQSSLRIESKERQGRLMVGYIASAKGTYFIFVSKNGWVAPGCPFEVFVDDPPPGYEGNFGASEWYECKEVAESADTKGADCSQEIRRNQGQKRNFSNIVQMILNCKKIFSLTKSEIPKIKVGESEATDFSVWSSAEFGQTRFRRRSFTFISSEGSTFPLDLSSGEDSKFFDTFDNLDIFKNDHSDIWAVQADEGDSISSSEYLVKSRRNSEDVLSYSCYSLETKSDDTDNDASSAGPKADAKYEKKEINPTQKKDSTKNIQKEQIFYGSFTDDFKFTSIPSIDKQESASETSVSEKIIEVAITENYECTIKKDNRTFLGKRRCKSIVSIYEVNNTRKGDLRRTKSAFYHFTGVYDAPGFRNNERKVVVKIGEYRKNKEEVNSSRTVKKLKTYWDNLTEKKENEPKKTKEIEKTGRKVANMKFVYEQLAKRNAQQMSKRRRTEETNKSYDPTAEVHSSSDKRTHNTKKTERITRSLERDLKGLFEDMNHGIGMPGIPNRLALLASLRSIKEQSAGAEPLLSTKRPLEFRRVSKSRSAIPWDQFLSAC